MLLVYPPVDSWGLDKAPALIPSILSGFTREIEKDYAVVKENYLRLQDLQEKLMLSVTRLYCASLGDDGELLQLLEADPSLRHFISSVDQANFENMKRAENYLLEQIKEVELMINQLADKKMEYRAEYDEMLAWKKALDEKILIIRASLAINIFS